MLTLCVVGLATGLIVYLLVRRLKYNYPPGPTGLPLLGNFFQIDRANLHEQAFNWSKKYGPVITVRLGTTPFIIVNGLDAALEVLVKRSTDFAGRMQSVSVDMITFGGKGNTFGSYGPTWKLLRRIASKALRHYMQSNVLERRIHDALETAFVETDNASEEFDPSNYISNIIGNILTGLCFGGKYNFNDKEMNYIFNRRDAIIKKYGPGVWEDFIPGLKYVYKTDAFKDFERFVKEMMEDFLRKRLKEAEATYEKDNIRHFTDTLLLARQEIFEEEEGEVTATLTEDHLVQTLGDIFFGGADTTRLTIKAAILQMVAFPDIQEKVQKEIDSVVGKDRLPSMIDRASLTYTEAVLHESMRLVSVLPLGFQHMTTCDTEISGYKIPKGTLVEINHWGLHHNPETWKDVERFIPERFLDENGKLGRKPDNWLPFSAGTRVCLGEFVARPMLHLIFAGLMQRYHWKMKSGKCPDFSRDGSAFGLSYKPYKVIAEKRF